jgi:hypothetical protein
MSRKYRRSCCLVKGRASSMSVGGGSLEVTIVRVLELVPAVLDMLLERPTFSPLAAAARCSAVWVAYLRSLTEPGPKVEGEL